MQQDLLKPLMREVPRQVISYYSSSYKIAKGHTHWERQYAKLLRQIVEYGQHKIGRNGGTRALFGQTLKADYARDGFPILQGRKIYWKGVIGELAGFLNGAETVEQFKSYGCNYWDEFADRSGKLNLDYGRTWRDFNGVDQLVKLRYTLKNNPDDRRMVINSWRPEKLEELTLPCCHFLYQWYVDEPVYYETIKQRLNMVFYMRSVDMMLGFPSDIILAAAWNALLANEFGYEPGIITMMLGDTHIYEEHVEGALEYISRVESRGGLLPLTYSLLDTATVNNFQPDYFDIPSYKHCHTQPLKMRLIK